MDLAEGWRKQAGRVFVLADLDAFYAQVEVKRDPANLKGKPVGVVQYNPFGDLATHTPEEHRIFNDSNGSLIAVSYEARAFGVKRNMRGDEARKLCPDLQLVQVPTAHGKADLTHYRSAGKQVTDILARLAVCEKASIDECYLDITAEAKHRLEASLGVPAVPVNAEQVHICGQEGLSEAWYIRPASEWGDGERLLACGAAAVADLRAAVKAELGFTCSAGIAHCKILAKLAAGLHKPSQQTLVPAASVPGLLHDLPIPKLRQLGGKFGEELQQQLGIKTVGELAAVPKSRLEALYGDSHAQWLRELSHGIDADEVKQRTLPKSISCGKTFQGAHALRALPDVLRWLKELGRELEERVAVDRAENAREPKLLTVHAGNISRSGPLRRPTADCIAEDSLALLKKWTNTNPGWSILGMSVGVSNFMAAPTGKSTLSRFFKPSSPAARRQEPAVVSPSHPQGPQQDLSPGRRSESCPESPHIAASSAQDGGEQQQRQPSPEAGAVQATSADPAPQQQAKAQKDAEPSTAAPRNADVDPEIWASLPADIQRELWLDSMAGGNKKSDALVAQRRPTKRKPASSGAPPKRGGTIAHYFAKQ